MEDRNKRTGKVQTITTEQQVQSVQEEIIPVTDVMNIQRAVALDKAKRTCSVVNNNYEDEFYDGNH